MVANAAVASDRDTVVFLSVEGVRLSQQGYADGIHEEGFAPLAQLLANFAAAGGKIYVCSPCFKKRGLDETKLVPGALIVGGAKLVEFMADGRPERVVLNRIEAQPWIGPIITAASPMPVSTAATSTAATGCSC